MRHLIGDSVPKLRATTLLILVLLVSLLTGFLPRVLAQSQPVPLYQADGIYVEWNGITHTAPSLLTTSQAEYNQFLARGWIGLGIVGRVYTTSTAVAGLVPLYRFYQPANPQPFPWPENYIYRTSLLPNPTTNGSSPTRLGYVFSQTAPDRAPLQYRALTYGANNPLAVHHYTTDTAVYNATTYPWYRKGTVCYVVAEPPSVPQNLRATAGNRVVNLAWDVSAQAVSYQLFRGLTSGGQGSVPYKTGLPKSNAPQYVDTAVTNGTAYYYKVVAVNSSGRLSAFSNEVRVVPAAPTGTNPNPWAKFRANNGNTGLAGAGTQSRLGSATWQFFVGSVGGSSSPALDSSGMVYVGSGIGTFFKLDPQFRTVVWTYQTSDAIQASPVLGNDGSVYIGSLDGCLYALRSNGTLKWRFGPITNANGQRAPIVSSAAVGTNGLVYIGGGNGFVYALNATTGVQQWQYPPTRSAGFMSSPAIGSDGTVYIGGRDFNLHAINGATGARRWIHTTRNWVESSPAIGPDGTVYVGSFDGYVYAVKDGVRRWAFGPTGSSFNGSPTLGSDGTLYIGNVIGNFYAINSATGAAKWTLPAVGTTWQHPSGGIWASASLSPDGMRVYIPVDNGYVYSLETATGAMRDFFPTYSFNHSSPAMGPLGEMYVGSHAGTIFMGRIY